MNPSDHDMWETSTTTTYDHVLMAVETRSGTMIYGKSVTLSRAMPLYIECGYQPYTTMIMENDDTVRISALILDASMDNLEYTHEALENLKGYPVEVWSWKKHNSSHVEPLCVPSGLVKAPILLTHNENGDMYVLGQESDINTIINTCTAFDIEVWALSHDNVIAGFIVDTDKTWPVIDLIQAAGFPLIDSGKSS